jgi:hypothetical protein
MLEGWTLDMTLVVSLAVRLSVSSSMALTLS